MGIGASGALGVRSQWRRGEGHGLVSLGVHTMELANEVKQPEHDAYS